VLSCLTQGIGPKKIKTFEIDPEVEVRRPFFNAIVNQAVLSWLLYPWCIGLPTYNQDYNPAGNETVRANKNPEEISRWLGSL
jgi:hypothetical protein